MAGKIKEITAKEYDSEVLSGGKVVVDFYSTECPPCDALASKYEALSNLYGDDIKFIKILRQENRELATSLDVTGSPTVLFYENGKISDTRFSGGIKRSEIMTNLDSMVSDQKRAEIHSKIEKKVTETDVLILGGGPAGLTAGIYLAQAHIKTIMVDPALPGGYVGSTHQVSNYPGFVEPVPGFMLAHYMSEQARGAGVEYRAAVEVNSVDLEAKQVLIDGFETIKAKKIIIATGSSPRPLGCDGEDKYRGNGISYCATCDAKYFQDKEAVVIGGGNSAIEEALFIAKFASKVTIVHQFAELQANKVAQEKAFNHPKIEFYLEHEPRVFKKHGAMDMEVVVEDLKTKKEKSIKTNGIFIFVGFIANLEGLGDNLELDDFGYIKTDASQKTNIKDVFAIGDIASKPYRQITIAVAEGTVAAMGISKELG